jgi:WD40 repeat protein
MEIRNTLGDYKFLETKLNVSGLHPLVDDFDIAYQVGYPRGDLNLIKLALNLSSHTLVNDPNQLWGQLKGRLIGFEEPVIENLFNSLPTEKNLVPLMGCLEGPGGSLIRTISGHHYDISTLCLDQGETLLASGSGEAGPAQGKVIITEIESGEELTAFSGHQYSITAVDLSRDGTLAVSASNDATIRIWDTRTGMERTVHTGHDGAVNAVRFARKSQTEKESVVISGGRDGTVRVWDLSDGSAEFIHQGHNSAITKLALCNDERYFVTGDDEGLVIIWDLQEYKVHRTCPGHTERITGIVIPDSDEIVVTASTDHTMRVWDLSTGTCDHILTGHTGPINSVCVFSDGARAVSSSNDNSIRIWDLINGHCLSTLSEPGGVSQLALTPGDKEIISGGQSCFQIWDSKTGRKIKDIQAPGGISQMITLQEKRWVVSGGFDQLVKIWDLDAMDIQRTRSPLMDFTGPIISHPKGQHALSFDKSNDVILWEIRSGDIKKRINVPKKISGGAAISADGCIAVAGGNVLDLAKGELRGHMNLPEYEIKSLAVTPTGEFAVTITQSEVIIWELESVTPVHSIKRSTRAIPPSLMPSGDILVRMKSNQPSPRHFVKIIKYTPEGINERIIGKFDEKIHGVYSTSDEKYLGVNAGTGFNLFIWDLHNDRLLTALSGHKETIGGLCISDERKKAITASRDGKIKSWDLYTGKELYSVQSQSNSVRNIQILSDEKHFVTSGGKEIEIWELETGFRQTGFTCEGDVHTLFVIPSGIEFLAQDYSGQIYVLELIG